MPDEDQQDKQGQSQDDGTRQPTQQQPPDVAALPDWAQKIITDTRSEAAGWRTKYREAEPLARQAQEAAERDKSETQKAVERAEKAERAAAEHQSALMRVRVATAKGLPADLADRLRGDSEDDLNADADRLLALVGARQVVGFDHGARGTPAPNDMNALIGRALSRR